MDGDFCWHNVSWDYDVTMKQTKTSSLKKGSKEAPVSDAPRTLLQVDLWTDIPSSDVSSARSGEINVLPSALAMVGDLLTTAGGEFRTSSTTSISAWFAETLQAVSAARRMQRLVRGFSRASVDGPLYACFTLTIGIDSGIEDDETLHNSIHAVRQNDSQDVFFAGSICEVANSIPGLQFKVPLSVSVASPDTAQYAILQLLPPAFMEGFAEEPLVRTEGRKSIAQDIAPEFALPPEPPRSQDEAGPIRPKPAPVATRQLDPPATLSDSLPMKISPRWAIIGFSTVGLVASILIFSPLFKTSPHAAAPPQPSASGTEKASPPPAAKTTPQPEPKTNPTPAPVLRVDAPKPPPPAAPKQPESARTRPAPEEPRPMRSSSAVTFSPAEIDLLIASADKDTGNGNYDKAIKEYTTVLNEDPSNALAKKGLAKALHNKGNN